MENNKNNAKIFLAFMGKDIKQDNKIFEIGEGFECWNLKKFKFNDFIKEIKKKIPPANLKVSSSNYKIDKEVGFIGITEEYFNQCSWGLFIPENLTNTFDCFETCFILNLYSPKFLHPLFCVKDLGIIKQEKNKKYKLTSFHTQDCSIFCKKEFIFFYRKMLEHSKYAVWDYNRVKLWKEEDWRMFIVASLYFGLKDYENSKKPFEWQRESAEMSTIMEALFTASDSQNEEIGYRLRKRISVLLSYKFPTIEEDIKELYKARSLFVHGSFFKQIAKTQKKAPGTIPSPDFEILYKHKEYVRFAIIAYLNLINAAREERIKVKEESVINMLEESIIDIKLRKQIVDETKEILSLM